ncbi:MAG: PASTA domain-containing protein, partial [Eubacteriales bacterium]|nr:PASTA domain-containing protein [Eubacteriales bacterium]
YLVMGYVEGITLKEYIKKRGALDGDAVLKLMKPVIEALASIHEEGIIHRDISPDNILINNKGKLVLIDFGSARQEQNIPTHSMTVMFKRGYTPTEQYQGRGRQGTWSDVYALCATMYFMLTAITPYESIDRMLGDELVSLEEMLGINLTASVKSIIMQGMAVQADKRIQNMPQLLEKLYRRQGRISFGDVKKRNLWSVALTVLILGIGIYTILWCQWDQRTQRLVGMQDNMPTEIPAEEKVINFPEKEETGDKIQQTQLPTQKSQERKYKVPSVTGLNYRDAIIKLKNKKFKIKKVYQNDTKPKGIVIKQNKKAGKTLSQGTEITLTISRGESENQPMGTTVPKNTKAPKTQNSAKSKSEIDDFVATIP